MYKTRKLENTRIEVADALRGIAVVGIILYHAVEHFNLGTASRASLSLSIDPTVFNVLTVLLSGKMYGIFALLFGLSFFIMRDNQEQKGKDFSLRFAWRMVLLFGFGILNLVFYDGDILTFYALLGLLMIPAGYLSTPVLWALTLFLLIQPLEIYSLISGWKPDISAMGKHYMALMRAHATGTFWESMVANMQHGFAASALWFIGKGRITQTLGLFYLGLLFGRHRLFYNEGNHLKVWRIVLAVSTVLVTVGVIFGAAGDGDVHFGELDALLHPLFNLAILLFIVSGVTLRTGRGDARGGERGDAEACGRRRRSSADGPCQAGRFVAGGNQEQQQRGPHWRTEDVFAVLLLRRPRLETLVLAAHDVPWRDVRP